MQIVDYQCATTLIIKTENPPKDIAQQNKQGNQLAQTSELKTRKAIVTNEKQRALVHRAIPKRRRTGQKLSSVPMRRVKLSDLKKAEKRLRA